MLENIFSKKVTTNRPKAYIEDFDVTQSHLETLLILEENYFDINRNHIQVTHLALKDQNVDILTEGMGDFIHSVIEFFKNLLNRFIEFMKNVFMIIYAYIGDFDSFLTKYKDKFSDLKPDFTVKGYEYTFSSSIPKLDEVTNVINDYNSELDKVHTMKKADIIKEREEFTSETFMNKVRAKVIGANGEITSEEFLDHTKRTYRNNVDKDEIDITVNKSYLDKVINDYPNLKRTFNDANKEKDRVISLIESMKNFFEKSASTYYRNTTKVTGMHHISMNSNSSGITKDDTVEHNYDLQKMDVINTFFNFKYTQSKEIGSICITVMTEKVNAIKECMKLYKVIIRKSLFSGPEKKIETIRGDS